MNCCAPWHCLKVCSKVHRSLVGLAAASSVHPSDAFVPIKPLVPASDKAFIHTTERHS